MREQSTGRWGIWLAGLAALLVAVVLIGALVTPLFGRDGSPASPSPADDPPSITSEQASTSVKQWIAGGTEALYVDELLADLVCDGYYQGGGTWKVMCRLPWLPVEGYFFTLSEVSRQVTPETEATLAFVRLLRQWGRVSGP